MITMEEVIAMEAQAILEHTDDEFIQQKARNILQTLEEGDPE